MSARLLAVLVAVCLCVPAAASALPFLPPEAFAPEQTGSLVIEGRGTAHGMGLAMDGVLGQARAGWSYTRILDLFYAGTQTSKAGGSIRVGLANAAEHVVELPGGGTVSWSGGQTELTSGASVTIGHDGSRYTVKVPGMVGIAQEEPPVPITTPTPTPPGPSPTSSPAPTGTPDPTPTSEPSVTSETPVRIVPEGSPAVSRLRATGRRYRGTMEIRAAAGGLWAINTVDLETYVRGIAEEKGAGWPVEGLKVLAVAARSLAVATRTWYDKHHEKGFDICPTGMCQVYLGYDGEEGSMTEATNATAGEIRMHDGRAILAMYHGNGGGQTDTYRLIYGNPAVNAHPYLRSVKYPFAKPKTWNYVFSPDEATARLRAGGIAVPGTVKSIEVLERGDSPRVRKARIVGTEGNVEATGHAIRNALGLPSLWFGATEEPEAPPPSTEPVPRTNAGLGLLPARREAAAPPPAESAATREYPWDVAALAVLALAASLALSTQRRGEA